MPPYPSNLRSVCVETKDVTTSVDWSSLGKCNQGKINTKKTPNKNKKTQHIGLRVCRQLIFWPSPYPISLSENIYKTTCASIPLYQSDQKEQVAQNGDGVSDQRLPQSLRGILPEILWSPFVPCLPPFCWWTCSKALPVPPEFKDHQPQFTRGRYQSLVTRVTCQVWYSLNDTKYDYYINSRLSF